MSDPLRLVVLLSGGGTTLENIFTHIESHSLNATVELVVSSRSDAYGLTRAKNHNVPTAVVASKDFRKEVDGKKRPDWQAMSDALNDVVLGAKPDLVCFAGFMCKYNIPPELENKVMNIHPALIPSFCGKGMYGHHVHEAVVNSGVKLSGCTVHFVNNEYDAGPIVVQRTCEVFDTDTPDDVAARVFEQECAAFPEAIRLFGEGALSVDGDIVKIRRDS